MYKASIIISLVSIASLCFGQYDYDFNQNCIHAYASIISLKFDEGKKLIEEEKASNPNNNIPYLLENYI